MLRLTEAEIRRAIQHYVAGKTGREPRDCDVALHPRGRKGAFAIVEILKAVPTLTGSVEVNAESLREQIIAEEKIGQSPA